MAKKKQNLVEGSMVLLSAVVVVKIIGAAYKIPLASVIGEDGQGFYNCAYNLYNVIYAIAVTGFPVAVSKMVAQFNAEGRYRDIKKVVHLSTWFFALIGVIGSAVLILFAKPYVELSNNPKAFWCVVAIAPSILFCCLMSAHRGYSQGMSNMIPTAVSQIVEVIFKALGGFGGALLLKGYFSKEYAEAGTVFGKIMDTASEAEVTILSLAAAGAIFGVTMSTVFGYLYLAVRSKKDNYGIDIVKFVKSPKAYSNRYILKQIISIGLPIALGAATAYITGLIDGMSIFNRLTYVINTDLGALYASHGGVLEQAGKELGDLANYLYGVYGYGMNLFNLVPALTGAFGMSALPLVTNSWLIKDRIATRKHMESVIRLTMLIAAPAGFGIAFLAGPISKLIYASRPIGSTLMIPMLAILGIAAIFVAITGPVNALLQAVGRVDIPVKLMFLGGAVKLAANYFLVAVPSLNIKAAPIGNLLCYIVISVLSLLILCKYTGISLSFGKIIFKPMFAGLITGAFGLLSYNLITMVISSTKIATVAAIGVAIIAYGIALGMLKILDREDVLGMPGGKKIAAALEKLHILG
ncbi:MAG: polysaccharide biosynthesis protein [Oscillospiraceae bacterium]